MCQFGLFRIGLGEVVAHLVKRIQGRLGAVGDGRRVVDGFHGNLLISVGATIAPLNRYRHHEGCFKGFRQFFRNMDARIENAKVKRV